VRRGLSGDLGTMPLKDLVSYLGNRRATGTLHLERGAVQKTVWIQEGMVLSASSNQPREYLGQFLINMGHLTEDQFLKAYQTQKETRVFLGKILVMIGLVTEDRVRSALGIKLRETLLEGFTWDDGSFVFDPNEPTPVFDGMEVRVDLLDVEREGEFRETAWQAIRSIFPHGRLRLQVDESKLTEAPKPGSLDEKLIALIRDHHRIDDMVLTLHANDFFVYQRLYALYRQEAVRVDESAPDVEGGLTREPVIGEEQFADDIAVHAEAFLSHGNPREAEALARRVYEMTPTPENQDLLRRCEKALLAQLSEVLLAGNRVPSLLVAPTMLKSMNLSAPEKYLLSRVDGRRDLRSIISVSPLQELEALKLFQQFIDGGLVALG
jgi:uncharacterized protein DUF4388